jgi:hypothetical protein
MTKIGKEDLASGRIVAALTSNEAALGRRDISSLTI